MTIPDPQAAELVERLRLHVTWRDSHGELNDAPNDAADLIERLTPTPEPSLREALEECADKLWVIHFGLADAAERKAAERALAIIDRQPRHIRAKWVFWHGDGARFRNVDSSFYALVRRVARKAAQHGRDFRRFRFHDLRHLFAVTFLREGRGTIYALQQILGHKSIKTTEGYLKHLTPEEQLIAKHGQVAQNPAQSERFGGENG